MRILSPLVLLFALSSCAGLPTETTPSGMTAAEFDARVKSITEQATLAATQVMTGAVIPGVAAAAKAGVEAAELKEKSGFSWLNLFDIVTGGIIAFGAIRLHRGPARR